MRPTPEPTAAPSAAPSGGALARLNERLRAALPTTPTATMAPVNLNGGYSFDRVLDAYEAALAPPLEILAKTFGLIYTTRTISRADSGDAKGMIDVVPGSLKSPVPRRQAPPPPP